MEKDVKKIFNYICGIGGVISFTSLMKFPSPLAKLSASEARRRLEEISQEHVCFVLEKEHGKISSVKMYFKIRLCVKYMENMCEDRDTCKYWHICKGYMEGNCDQTNCQLSHDFKDEENLTKVEGLELNLFPSNAIRKVLYNCLPRVCIDYITTCCVLGESCINLHLCPNLVQNLCSAANCCPFNHELNSEPNVSALRKSHLPPKMPQKILFSHILLPKELQSKHGENYVKERQQVALVLNSGKPAQTCATADQHSQQKCRLNNLSQVSEMDQSTSTLQTFVANEFGEHKPATESRKQQNRRRKGLQIPMEEPSEKAVFECLLKEYNGTSKFSVIISRKELFPSAFKDAASWFRVRPNTFLLSETEKGEIEEVSAFSSRARLCFDSAKCQKVDCRYFHMCRSHVADECKLGVTCKANHNLQNPRDRCNIQRCNLDYLTDDQFRHLLRKSSPQICWDYNKGGCALNERCCKLHICKEFVRKSCRYDKRCDLDHEDAFDTNHTKKLLARYNLGRVPTHVVLRTLLICREKGDSPSEDPLTAEHIHEDSRERHICVDFILGKCRKGSSCEMHHCRQPYLWQCQEPISSSWTCFSVEESESIEESYCDCETVSCSHNLDLSSISLTHFSSSEMLEVNYNRMTICGALKLRRLSTESYVKLPDVVMATKWMWFWDSGDTFVEYDLGGETTMQEEIELFFLDKAECYPFKVAKHSYKLDFSRMHQVNLDPRYNTTRNVRRRPVFRNRSEVQQLIKEARRKPKKQARQEKENNLPASWGTMPPGCEYKRSKIPPNLADFREVEKLFRKTVSPKKATILAIERVQNPFMWEKYQRKKVQMQQRNGRSAVNEQMLFHGTSPDIIDSICKQNFDWRLHGKNATVYGQGCYFARDASYSYSYTKEGSDSSRFMFVAKVLVGTYTEGSSEMRRPPPRSHSDPSDLYDSCVNDMVDPSIFVVFDNDQYYPSHVIEFTGSTSRDRTVTVTKVPSRLPTTSSSPGYGGYTTRSSGVGTRSSTGYGGYTASSSGVSASASPRYSGYAASSPSASAASSSRSSYGISGRSHSSTASNYSVTGIRNSATGTAYGITGSRYDFTGSSGSSVSGSSSYSTGSGYGARSRPTSPTKSSSKSSKESSCSVM